MKEDIPPLLNQAYAKNVEALAKQNNGEIDHEIALSTLNASKQAVLILWFFKILFVFLQKFKFYWIFSIYLY